MRASEGISAFIGKGKSYVVMDAPPDKEPCEPFVRIGDWMRKAGVRVPEIFEQKVEDGFLVLSDFGDLHYQEALEGTDRNRLYDLAIDEILRFQNRLATVSFELPVFDTAWQEKELDIFREWCLPDLTKKSIYPDPRIDRSRRSNSQNLHASRLSLPKLTSHGRRYAWSD